MPNHEYGIKQGYHDEIMSLLKEYHFDKDKALLWWNLLHKTYSYCLPWKDNFNDPADGQQRGYYVYDVTATLALKSFTGKMLNALMPQDQQFMQFTPGFRMIPPQLKHEQHVSIKSYLDRKFTELTNLWWSYLQNSNFWQVRAEFMQDWCVGTAAMIINETGDPNDPFIFHNTPVRDLSIGEGPRGNIERFWRSWEKYPIKNITRHWRGAVLTDNYKYLSDHSPLATTDLIEGVTWDEREKMWRYTLMTFGGKDVFMDNHQQTKPHVVARYEVTHPEQFGRGPAIDTLTLIEVVNKIMRDQLVALEFAINPPLLADNTSFVNLNNMRVAPGSIVPARVSPRGGWSVAPYPQGAQFDVSSFQISDLRNMIMKMFNADPIGPIETPVKTATEITYRMKEAAQSDSAAVCRFSTEVFPDIGDRTLHILMKGGHLKPLRMPIFDPSSSKLLTTFDQEGEPDSYFNEVSRIDKANIGVKITSPIVNAEGIANAERLQMVHLMLAQMFGPDAAASFFHAEKIPEIMAKWMNTDESLVKNENEVKAVADQMVAAQREALLQAPSKVTTSQGQSIQR